MPVKRNLTIKIISQSLEHSDDQYEKQKNM